MPTECDVAVIDVLDIVVEGDLEAIVKSPCPEFQIPCPVIIVTGFDGTVFGATFRWQAVTSEPCIDRYRQRQVVGGVPGAWSSWLVSADGAHPAYITNHQEFNHRMSNKAQNSLWDYQILFTPQDIGIAPEVYPNCGNSVIRVQYPNKSGGGGGFDPDYPIPT